MANITKEQVIDGLSEQSRLEIISLVKDLEAKWSVSTAALVAMAVAVTAAVVAATAAVDSPAPEQKPSLVSF
jgi:ribosomal protein L7/L12